MGSQAARTLSYAYDAASRLVRVRDHLGNETVYTYDLAGNRAMLTYPNQVVTTYDCDHRNRLSLLTTANGGTTLARFGYAQYADGKRKQITELDGRTIGYAYDPSGRLTRETKKTAAGNIIYDIGQNYDAVGLYGCDVHTIGRRVAGT